MTAVHVNLTGSQLHEPKGVSAASANTFNIAFSGVNSWGTLHYVEAQTASASSNLVFDDLDNCREIILTMRDVKLSTSAGLYLYFSSNNGSSYANGNIFFTSRVVQTTSSSSATQDSMPVHTNLTTGYISGKLIISNFNKALVSTVNGVTMENTAASFAGTAFNSSMLCGVNAATVWNCLKLEPSAGNLTSGSVTLEGLKA